ncbi:MAG: hypothetical protein ABIQ95_00350 [Bdellovibrionia bacterium]
MEKIIQSILLTIIFTLFSFFQALPSFAADGAPEVPAEITAPNVDLYFQDSPVDVESGLGRDHARLEEDQSQKTQAFLKKYFLNDDGTFSLEKVDAILKILQDEKEKLRKDLYESTALERAEVDVYSQKKP